MYDTRQMLLLVRFKPHPCTLWELAYNAGIFCGLKGYPSSLPSPFSPAALSATARTRAAVHAAAGFNLEICDLNVGVNVDSGANAENLILISLRTATGFVLYDCQL